jgi:low affinity Fe/Cu permease
MGSLFSSLALWTSRQSGRPGTFILAVVVILVWAVSGPMFHWSDTWQLVINTGTTIVTFLMVFLIQHTQNRDTTAIHLKLDELIRVNKAARNVLIDLEEAEESQIEQIKQSFSNVASQAAERAAQKTVGKQDGQKERVESGGKGGG